MWYKAGRGENPHRVKDRKLEKEKDAVIGNLAPLILDDGACARFEQESPGNRIFGSLLLVYVPIVEGSRKQNSQPSGENGSQAHALGNQQLPGLKKSTKMRSGAINVHTSARPMKLMSPGEAPQMRSII